MKKVGFVLILTFLAIDGSPAQQVKARSRTGGFDTPARPPVLECTAAFVDSSRDGILQAGEGGTVVVTVRNTGGTAATSVTVTMTSSVGPAALTLSPSVNIKEVPAGGSALATFDVVAAAAARSESVLLRVDATAQGGFKAPPISITIPVREALIVRDTTPPTIELWEPVVKTTRGLRLADEEVTYQTVSATALLKGIVKDDSGVQAVFIKGQPAATTKRPEGVSFEEQALLELGENEIEIRAIDVAMNETSIRLIVTRQPVFAGQRWGVVIGISDYKSPDIPDLRYAHRDAEGFYRILTTPVEQGGMGIPKPNVRFLLNEQATSVNVREAIMDFLKSAIEEDIVFIYFAGHGAPDPDRPKVLYLLTHDSDLRRLASTSIKMQEIQDALKDYVAARTVLVFTDACHSRGVTGMLATRDLARSELVNEYLAELSRARPSTLTFSASDVNQLSQEDTKWGGGHGVFTYYLLEGLRGKADRDGDGKVRLGELIFYVTENVRRDTRAQQSPISSGNFDFNLLMTISPGR